MKAGNKNTEYPPDPSVLCSKLDQYPDEAWGWNSVFSRDHLASDHRHGRRELVPRRGKVFHHRCKVSPAGRGSGAGDPSNMSQDSLDLFAGAAGDVRL